MENKTNKKSSKLFREEDKVNQQLAEPIIINKNIFKRNRNKKMINIYEAEWGNPTAARDYSGGGFNLYWNKNNKNSPIFHYVISSYYGTIIMPEEFIPYIKIRTYLKTPYTDNENIKFRASASSKEMPKTVHKLSKKVKKIYGGETIYEGNFGNFGYLARDGALHLGFSASQAANATYSRAVPIATSRTSSDGIDTKYYKKFTSGTYNEGIYGVLYKEDVGGVITYPNTIVYYDRKILYLKTDNPMGIPKEKTYITDCDSTGISGYFYKYLSGHTESYIDDMPNPGGTSYTYANDFMDFNAIENYWNYREEISGSGRIGVFLHSSIYTEDNSGIITKRYVSYYSVTTGPAISGSMDCDEYLPLTYPGSEIFVDNTHKWIPNTKHYPSWVKYDTPMSDATYSWEYEIYSDEMELIPILDSNSDIETGYENETVETKYPWQSFNSHSGELNITKTGETSEGLSIFRVSRVAYYVQESIADIPTIIMTAKHIKLGETIDTREYQKYNSSTKDVYVKIKIFLINPYNFRG